MIRFLHPWFLAALALLPLVLYGYLRLERAGRARLIFSDLTAFKTIAPSGRVRARHAVIGLRLFALAALVIALARPQHGNHIQEVISKGIDIMIVLDNSTSMSQQDLDPNRLAAAKQVVAKFVAARQDGLQNDRIGLVVFSKIAFTQCPLTVDYTILKQIVSKVQFTRKEFDGTAIGSALATGVARLKDSTAKSKVLILVTDGENNAGLDPLTAASLAEATKVKVYAIGVVPTGMMQKVQDAIFGARFVPSMPTVNETQMQEIAKTTGGRYFRASDEQAFADIFKEIDRMEKTEVKVKEYYRYSELYLPWAALALGLLLVEQLLSRTLFRRLP
jgi:Ca-activated chloride channel family protein